MTWRAIFVFFGLASSTLAAERVFDPIADFLTLPIRGFYTEVSVLTEVHVLRVDLDGDGRDEIFVGHAQPWNGDPRMVYWSAYAKLPFGYRRLLPKDKALQAIFWGGDRSRVFVGFVREVQSQGMLVIEPERRHSPDDPEKLLRALKSDRTTVYHINKDQLVATELGPIDFASASGRSFFERYFGGGAKSRPVRAESLSADLLKKRGYQLPVWKTSGR